MENYLIYLCYGKNYFLNETLFSLISFYKYHKNDAIQIIIYTDDVYFFKKHLSEKVTLIELNEEKIKYLKGAINFNHRLKIKILEDFSSKFNGNYLFIDSDTYFKKNSFELFEKINSDELLMDVCEGKLSENNGGLATKFKKFLKKQNEFSTKIDTQTIKIKPDFIIFNSGVIGFNTKFKTVLPFVIEFVDELYSKCKLFTIEQIGFNYYFQKIKMPSSTEDFIHHYWYFKEFRVVLNCFFEHHKEKKMDQLVLEIDTINPEKLAFDKLKYKKMTFFQKQFRKITTGRKWQIMEYKL